MSLTANGGDFFPDWTFRPPTWGPWKSLEVGDWPWVRPSEPAPWIKPPLSEPWTLPSGPVTQPATVTPAVTITPTRSRPVRKLKAADYLPKALKADPQFKALLKQAQADTGMAALGPLADWLEEKGATKLAYALRWAKAKGHRPYKDKGESYPGRTRWAWAWVWNEHFENEERTPSRLPGVVYEALGASHSTTFLGALIELADAIDHLRSVFEGVS